MTEEEAKTKWCPMVRTVLDAANYASGNHFEGGQFKERTTCKGSECMMWRLQHNEDDGFEPTNGYCGLAGRHDLP